MFSDRETKDIYRIGLLVDEKDEVNLGENLTRRIDGAVFIIEKIESYKRSSHKGKLYFYLKTKRVK